MYAHTSDESGAAAVRDPFRLPEELRGRLAAALRDELVRACLAAADRGVDPADLLASVTERTARLRLPLPGQQPQQLLGDAGHLAD